jgi:CheY-like chemotaxis protein
MISGTRMIRPRIALAAGEPAREKSEINFGFYTFDVMLLTDVRMPGMDWFELARRARVLRPHLNIVFTSGYLGNVDPPMGAKLLSKPFRLADVQSVAPVTAG